ncbi:hypothetical protein PR048_029144 [Dryococelus australis]|uniref:Uncharacterized protein n=1 Tax=Dryococelus australis TaxID=614101 RepID=A0ABQ9GF71_9NEOP|nr:hypothetical protein PR048_029144 [Dryococelus australis]
MLFLLLQIRNMDQTPVLFDMSQIIQFQKKLSCNAGNNCPHLLFKLKTLPKRQYLCGIHGFKRMGGWTEK